MQTHHRLDDVRMNAIDREHAKAHVRSAELTIDFVADVVAKTRLVSAAIARQVINLAWHIRSKARTKVNEGELVASERMS